MLENLETVVKNTLGDSYDSENLYIICLQGSSGSGKTTYAKYLEGMLKQKDYEVLLLHIDSFFNFESGSKEDEANYDFDNPATIRWDAIDNVLRDIINKKSEIHMYNRSKLDNEAEEKIHNPGFNIVIIEGLYSFNCFGKRRFNIEEFDPSRSEKMIKNEFVDNENYHLIKKSSRVQKSSGDFYKSIKIINIRFLTCFARLTSIRVQRDKIIRKLSFNEVYMRICNLIWPATVKWVYSKAFDCDVDIQHGNFNFKGIEMLSESLFEFFNVRDLDRKIEIPHDFSKSLSIKCLLGCDRIDGCDSLYLEDREIK